MGQVSVPQGLFGGSTLGGSTSQAGTTNAITNSAGTLEAYNPNTMSQTTQAPTTAPPPEFTAAGMDAGTGLPSYVTNWLQAGGTGTMPTSTGIMPSSPAQQSTAAAALTPQSTLKPLAESKWNPAIPKPAVKPAVGPATAPAAAGAAPALRQVGGNMQQPLYVSDQWNGSTGTSQQMATPALGGPSANQGGQAPFWSDGKGNFFYDAQGTKPVTGAVTQQLKNQYGGW
jgi:hypothetical protein